jgi:hypothetical protein
MLIKSTDFLVPAAVGVMVMLLMWLNHMSKPVESRRGRRHPRYVVAFCMAFASTYFVARIACGAQKRNAVGAGMTGGDAGAGQCGGGGGGRAAVNGGACDAVEAGGMDLDGDAQVTGATIEDVMRYIDMSDPGF